MVIIKRVNPPGPPTMWLRWIPPLKGVHTANWQWTSMRDAATRFDTMQEAQDTCAILHIPPTDVDIEPN